MIALVAFLVGAHAAAAEEATVEAARHGNGVAINARAIIEAPFSVIWATLTDYDHLSDFIPGMKRSHVVGRRGTAAIVAQSGSAGFLFFHYPIEVVVESDEHAPSAITIHVLEGNLRQLDGGYELERLGEGVNRFELRWRGVIEPDIDLPSFVTVPVLRANIADQFRGMVTEIERRESRRQKTSE